MSLTVPLQGASSLDPEAPYAERSITYNELSLHGVPDSCWVAIAGEVYDVTPFLAKVGAVDETAVRPI